MQKYGFSVRVENWNCCFLLWIKKLDFFLFALADFADYAGFDLKSVKLFMVN